MGHVKGESILFLSSVLCLLLMGKASFALTSQEINDILSACMKAGCGMTCSSILEQLFCYCSDCKGTAAEAGANAVDTSVATAGTVYQVGKDQYLCAANAGNRAQCVSFPYQLKVLDEQNLPTTGNDKAAVDEISRLKGMNLPARADVVAPVEGSTTVQQPTKSTFPVFRRTVPVVR